MLINVIVPVYNVEKYLQKCIDSILAQTFTDFELVLVNDGSTDRSGEICDEYAETDSRVKVIHKQYGGVADARNAGLNWCLESSNSDWIAFVDSDDWVHPKYLEILYKTAIDQNASISVCGYVRTDKYLPFEDISDFEVNEINTEILFLEHNLEATVAWGKLCKKDYFTDVRYPFGRIHEDEFVTYKLLFQNKTIPFVNLPLYFYYNNSTSIMNSKWSIRRFDIVEALKQQYEYFKNFNNGQFFIMAVERYAWALVDQYEKVNACVDLDNKEKYIKYIRRELRRCLRQKGINEVIANNRYFKEIAYPQKAKIIKFNKRVRKKINRMLKK